MKKYISISLFIFAVIVIVVIAGGLIFNRSDSSKSNSKLGNQTAVSPLPLGQSITLVEVAKHNNKSDCWQVIHGKVYNVTSYIDEHPAGPEAVIKNCGTDATIAFDTKGGKGKGHPASALKTLEKYYLGEVGN